MWSKISNVLKPLTSSKEDSHTNKGSEVLNKVLEQHPNLSVFHPNDSGIVGRHSVDGPSPSVHSKKNMFKRLSKPLLHRDDTEEIPALPLHSPLLTQSRKMNNPLDFNPSQTSTPSLGDKPNVQQQRSSFDVLRDPPARTNFMDSTRSAKDSRRRPSLDLLREGDDSSPRSLRINPVDTDFLSPTQDKGGYSSVRSILRDRNTPGTGQSVRFFSRNDFKVISPDNSAALSEVLVNKPQPPIPIDEEPFVDRKSGSPDSLAKISNLRPRPKLAGLFTLLDEETNRENLDTDVSAPVSAPPLLDNSIFHWSSSPAHERSQSFSFGQTVFYSMANKFGDSKSGEDMEMEAAYRSSDVRGLSTDNVSPSGLPVPSLERLSSSNARSRAVSDTAFQDMLRKSPKMTLPEADINDESGADLVIYSGRLSEPNPFSTNANAYHGDSKSGEDMEMEAAYPSSDVRGPSPDNVTPSGLPVPSPDGLSSSNARIRAVSDTAFQDMLTKMALPEADINDESSTDFIYSGGPSEPDPFSANANTYYTPQVNIPVTPPKGIPKHLRTTSKEESLIMSLQTQLTLKTELCGQYETDLKARDELVEILGKKLGDVEKDEGKRKAAVRSWRKKVQELERNCRLLEEAMDRSRQECVERSVMDEASGEALRMLHRQIQGLEGQKGEWVKREEQLKGEVDELERVVRDRTEEMEEMKEKLRRGDERERELKEGLREAKDQIEMMGDCSIVIGGVDDDDEEKEHGESAETQRFRIKEMELVQEVAEMKAKVEWVEVEKRGVEEQVESLTSQLRTKEEEWKLLKEEVEAQWERTEKMGERVGELEREKTELVAERDALRADVENLEEQIETLENEWREGDERRNELEEETREVWRVKDDLEQERVKLEDSLQQAHRAAEQLHADSDRREIRVVELEQEKQFANECISRLEENLRKRDEEVAKYTERFIASDAESEQLRGGMNRFKREQERILSEQANSLKEALRQKEMMEQNFEDVVRSKVEADLELKASKEREGRLLEEVEGLKREAKMAKMDSADKEVKIMQIMKRSEREREDLLGLGIALESKQQELELIKRKLNVRGTGGSTPAPASASKASRHRRDSSVFTATPLVSSRPPSAMSEDTSSVSVGVVDKSSNETNPTASKVALGKSNRVNGTSLSSTSASLSSSVTKGSMGPPPARSRPSINNLRISGTQTPTLTQIGSRTGLARSSSASAFATPRAGGVTSPTPTRRGMSANSERDTTPAGKMKLAKSRSVMNVNANGSPIKGGVAEEGEDEKENVDLTEKISASTRRNPVPVPS